MNVPVAIGLGSNLGNLEERLDEAAAFLERLLEEPRRGGLYRSAALGGGEQPDYLNSVVVGHTRLEPEPLLAMLKFLEWRAGRRSAARWASRALDLDLLLYGDVVASRAELTLPHPQLERRPFVLAPLADAAPGLRLPGSGRSVEQALEQAGGRSSLTRVAWPRSGHGGGSAER